MRAAFLSLLLVVSSLGCATDPPTTQKDLSGVVRDRLSGRRISGATITFRSDTLYSETARTDGDGHYEMIVETDTLLGQVRAERSGYQTAEETVYFDTDERVIDLDLLPTIEDDEE